ncbi:MAG: VOC family protein [Armatimonadetes bacterium]|nr:VOC family protein [Armatimonadota bacterium]
MPRSVATFLMFNEPVAEQALQLYVSLFRDSEVRLVEHWGPGEPGREGTVKRAEFTLAGHHLMVFDSPVKHEFGFTPATSLFVECESESELDRAFAELSVGGGVMMAPGDHGFSRKFTWFSDRFGVSWQLNLA